MASAKKTAPTRPHPRSPDTPPGNLVAGTAAGVVDKVGATVCGPGPGWRHGRAGSHRSHPRQRQAPPSLVDRVEHCSADGADGPHRVGRGRGPGGGGRAGRRVRQLGRRRRRAGGCRPHGTSRGLGCRHGRRRPPVRCRPDRGRRHQRRPQGGRRRPTRRPAHGQVGKDDRADVRRRRTNRRPQGRTGRQGHLEGAVEGVRRAHLDAAVEDALQDLVAQLNPRRVGGVRQTRRPAG